MLKLELIPNAYHSLYHAIEHISDAEDEHDAGREFDHEDHAIEWRSDEGHITFWQGNLVTKPPSVYSYKFAILHLAQGIELLIKGYIHSKEPEAIFSNPDSTYTISLRRGLEILIEWDPELLDEQQIALILQTKDLRNSIEHYAFQFDRTRAREICIDILSLCNYLTYELFDVRLVDEWGWDPWTDGADPIADLLRTLLAEASDQGRKYHEAIAKAWHARNPEDKLYICFNCGARGASRTERCCIVCGESTNEELGQMIDELEALTELSQRIRELKERMNKRKRDRRK